MPAILYLTKFSLFSKELKEFGGEGGGKQAGPPPIGQIKGGKWGIPQILTVPDLYLLLTLSPFLGGCFMVFPFFIVFKYINCLSTVQFSHSVVSDSL